MDPHSRVVFRAKLASMCEIPSPLIECCLLGERYDMSRRRLPSGFYFKGAMNLIMAFPLRAGHRRLTIYVCAALQHVLWLVCQTS